MYVCTWASLHFSMACSLLCFLKMVGKLGCVCFGGKWFQEIIFPQTQVFGSNGKFHFPENCFLSTEIFTFDPEMILHPHFHFKSFPERERERERRESLDRRAPIVDRAPRRSTSGAIVWRACSSIDERCDRPMSMLDNRDARRSWSSIAPSIAISRRSRSRCLLLLLGLSGFVFSFFFSKHQKIFFRKFFEMQPNTWKHFPSWKIAFPENGIFSGNAFTRTKHSLNGVLYEEKRVLLKHSWSYSAENQRKLMKKRKKETEWIES